MDDISVTIVTYRDFGPAEDAVRSIEQHTSPDLKKRIYIVDNSGSDFKEPEDFIRFLSQYPDVHYVKSPENHGYGAGHNNVMDRLDSRYHAILNPDILLKEDSLKTIVGFMDRDDSVGMVIPRVLGSDGELQAVYRNYPTVWDMFIRRFLKRTFSERIAENTLQNEDYSKPFRVPFGQGSFLVIRTELFLKLKGFDEHYFMYLEDADLCRRVNEVSKLMYCPDTEVIHAWGKGSHRNLKLFWSHLRSMIYYFRKWGVQWF